MNERQNLITFTVKLDALHCKASSLTVNVIFTLFL